MNDQTRNFLEFVNQMPREWKQCYRKVAGEIRKVQESYGDYSSIFDFDQMSEAEAWAMIDQFVLKINIEYINSIKNLDPDVMKHYPDNLIEITELHRNAVRCPKEYLHGINQGIYADHPELLNPKAAFVTD